MVMWWTVTASPTAVGRRDTMLVDMIATLGWLMMGAEV